MTDDDPRQYPPRYPSRVWLRGQLMGVAEIAEYLSGSGRPVTRSRASQYTQHPMFPEPVTSLAMGKVWLRQDVEAFFAIDRPAGRHLPTADSDHYAPSPRLTAYPIAPEVAHQLEERHRDPRRFRR